MKIKVLRQVMISGESVKAGSLLEVSYQDAIALIAMGKAEEAPVAPEPEPEAPACCPPKKPAASKSRTKE